MTELHIVQSRANHHQHLFVALIIPSSLSLSSPTPLSSHPPPYRFLALHPMHCSALLLTRDVTSPHCGYRSTPNLHMQEGMVTELLLGANDDVIGVKTFFGVDFHAPAVVLTTGASHILLLTTGIACFGAHYRYCCW